MISEFIFGGRHFGQHPRAVPAKKDKQLYKYHSHCVSIKSHCKRLTITSMKTIQVFYFSSPCVFSEINACHILTFFNNRNSLFSFSPKVKNHITWWKPINVTTVSVHLILSTPVPLKALFDFSVNLSGPIWTWIIFNGIIKRTYIRQYSRDRFLFYSGICEIQKSFTK